MYRFAMIKILIFSVGGVLAFAEGVFAENVEACRATGNLDEFYQFDTGEVTGRRGEVVRCMELSPSPQNGSGYRVLYRTERSEGRPTIASTLVFVPAQPRPEPSGGAKMAVFLHETTGVVPRCAPSRLRPPIPGLSSFLKDGDIVVAPDLIGLGAFLRGEEDRAIHPYLQSGPTAAAVSDAIAAAKFLISERPDPLTVADEVALFGHSQGGYAVLAALSSPLRDENTKVELAVVSAPPGRLDRIVPQQRTEVGLILTAYIAASYAHANPGLDMDALLSEKFAKIVPGIAGLCIVGERGEQLNILRNGGFGEADFGETDGGHLRTPALPEEWRDAFVANEPAILRSELGSAPFRVVVSQGGSDPLVPWRATREDVMKPLCEVTGGRGTFVFYPLAGHNSQFDISRDALVAHVRATLSGGDQDLAREALPTPPVDSKDMFRYAMELVGFSFREGCEFFDNLP